MRIENPEMRETLAALGLVRHTEQEMKKFTAAMVRVIAPALGGRRAREIAEKAAQDMVPAACLWAALIAASSRAASSTPSAFVGLNG